MGDLKLLHLASITSRLTIPYGMHHRGQSPEFPNGGTKRVGKDYAPGEAFGEIALLAGPTATRKAGIVAENACTCKLAHNHSVALVFI